MYVGPEHLHRLPARGSDKSTTISSRPCALVYAKCVGDSDRGSTPRWKPEPAVSQTPTRFDHVPSGSFHTLGISHHLDWRSLVPGLGVNPRPAEICPNARPTSDGPHSASRYAGLHRPKVPMDFVGMHRPPCGDRPVHPAHPLRNRFRRVLQRRRALRRAPSR